MFNRNNTTIQDAVQDAAKRGLISFKSEEKELEMLFSGHGEIWAKVAALDYTFPGMTVKEYADRGCR
jgi:hypothetical protein